MLTKERILTQVSYDPSTGLFTRNKTGKQITTKNLSGYVVLNLFGEIKYAHRIAWFLTYGKWAKRLDHINGKPSDNRIENLRECSQSQNIANCEKRTSNKTGLKGVHFYKPLQKYQASIKINYKGRHLGYYSSPVNAGLAYDRAAHRLYGEFALLNFPELKHYWEEMNANN